MTKRVKLSTAVAMIATLAATSAVDSPFRPAYADPGCTVSTKMFLGGGMKGLSGTEAGLLDPSLAKVSGYENGSGPVTVVKLIPPNVWHHSLRATIAKVLQRERLSMAQWSALIPAQEWHVRFHAPKESKLWWLDGDSFYADASGTPIRTAYVGRCGAD